MATHKEGTVVPTPAAITPNAALTTGQKTALLALQTARANFEKVGNGIFLPDTNDLLAAVDVCLASMV